MPRGIYRKIKCTGFHGKFTPTEHQVEAMQYFLLNLYKGLLLDHELGSGKTCTAFMIADKMLKRKLIKSVYILSPGSLRQGWVNEYCFVCGKTPKQFEENYIFITYNYNVGNDLPSFDDSLVIIDEVHNLINGAKNLSKTPTAIYDKLYNSNCRIVALSGTPIYNYIYEFALLGRLLKPGDTFPDIRKGTTEFTTLFDTITFEPKNRTKIKRMLEGIVSYYPGAGKDFVPEIKYQEPIKVQMSEEQEKFYWDRSIQEEALNKPPKESLKKTNSELYEVLKRLYIMAKKNILTRSASNFWYPPETEGKPDLPVRNGGWVSKEALSHGRLKIYSPKFVAVLTNIIAHDKQKHVLFSFFKQKGGVILLKTLLTECGITAEIFSGDLDDNRRRLLLKRFNSPSNRYGDDIRVLLVTEAGAEGISVLESRHMHILESSPRMNKTIQAIGRVARFKSHENLPKDERNIKVWQYWSVASPFSVTINTTHYLPNGEEKKTQKILPAGKKEIIDETLYNSGMQTIDQINTFLALLREVSVTTF